MLSEKYVSVVNAILRVIPEEEIGIAISKGQRDSQEMWGWGDRSLLWIKIALSSGIACTKDHVYTAHSQVSGIPKRTLRHYADHARFFDQETRDKYEPMPYAHFVVAKSFGDRWQEILESSADYLEKWGKYPTAELLEWLHSRNAQPILEISHKVERVTDEMMESMRAEDESKYDEIDIEIDPAVATETQARSSLVRMEITTKLMEDLMPWLPISESQKVRLYDAIDNLLSEIEGAMQEVSHPAPDRDRH